MARTTETALRNIISKADRSSRTTALFCWVSGALFILSSVYFSLVNQLAVVPFCAALGLAFIAAGFWYNNVSKK